jgi:hypothetical protein
MLKLRPTLSETYIYLVLITYSRPICQCKIIYNTVYWNCITRNQNFKRRNTLQLVSSHSKFLIAVHTLWFGQYWILNKNIAVTNEKEWSPAVYRASFVCFKGQLWKVRQKWDIKDSKWNLKWIFSPTIKLEFLIYFLRVLKLRIMCKEQEDPGRSHLTVLYFKRSSAYSKLITDYTRVAQKVMQQCFSHS